MANDSRKKTATFLGATIIGLIIISFMFSGYQSLSRSTPDTVATVGNIPITLREFRMEYDRQLKFYKQIMGGKELTSLQIERFNLKGAAIQSLANRKLMLLFAEDLGIIPSREEVSNEIMKLPYFKTDGKFDLTLYKNLLARNQYSPTDFETLTAQDLTTKNLYNLMKAVPLSKNYTDDLSKFRAQSYQSIAVKLPKNPLKKMIKVTDAQINKFLKDPKNLARVESMFVENKTQYDQPEQVYARHILIKGNDAEKKIQKIHKEATPLNFAKLADRYTEDPSGKGKGGMLGWFARGRMVPEFEKVAFSQKPGTISKPVKTNFGQHIILVEKRKKAKMATFAQHKKEIAKELLQNNLKPKVEGIAKKVSKTLTQAIVSNNTKKIDSIKEKYQLSFDKKSTINRLDGATGTVKLRPDQLKKIFDYEGKLPKVFTFDTPLDTTLVKISQEKTKPKKANDNLAFTLAQKLQQDIVKTMGESVKTKVFLQN